MTNGISNNPVIQTNQNTFDSIVNNNENDNRYVYVLKDGSIQTEGGFTHLFTMSATNISTLAAMLRSLTKKYGDEIGNAISDLYSDFESGDKQLTVGDVRAAFKHAESAKMKQSMDSVIEKYSSNVGNILS